MAEQTLYNHLLAAQSPDGQGWAYYVGLRDSKRYRWHTDPECCPSRGVRALALLPLHVFCQDDRSVYVNFYEPCEANLDSGAGSPAKITISGDYPFKGDIHLTLQPENPVEFNLCLRLPGWCKQYQLRVNSMEAQAQTSSGYLVLNRLWKPGDVVDLTFEMPVKLVFDRLGNVGRLSITRGPVVYAADSSFLPAGVLLDDVILPLNPDTFTEKTSLVWDEESRMAHLLVPRLIVKPASGDGMWSEDERYVELAESGGTSLEMDSLRMVPFFDAGNRDTRNYRQGIFPNDEPVRNVTYQVWLPYYPG